MTSESDRTEGLKVWNVPVHQLVIAGFKVLAKSAEEAKEALLKRHESGAVGLDAEAIEQNDAVIHDGSAFISSVAAGEFTISGDITATDDDPEGHPDFDAYGEGTGVDESEAEEEKA